VVEGLLRRESVGAHQKPVLISSGVRTDGDRGQGYGNVRARRRGLLLRRVEELSLTRVREIQLLRDQ